MHQDVQKSLLLFDLFAQHAAHNTKMRSATVNMYVHSRPMNGSSDEGKSIDCSSLEYKQSTFNNEKISKKSSWSLSMTRLDIQWRALSDLKYLTHGGSSWIYSATYNGDPVVVKLLMPKYRNDPIAVMDIEKEVGKFDLIKTVIWTNDI